MRAIGSGVIAWLLGLIPLGWLLVQIWQLQSGDWEILGPEPGKAIVHFTGEWGLYCLIASLAATTLWRRGRQRLLLQHRRTLGLLCFLYTTLHLLAYCAFLLEWQWQDVASEIIKRPYLLLGAVGWLLLIPLAVTSTRNWQRRLGSRWKKLHRLVYVVAVLVAIHYLLQIRADWLEPVLFSSMLFILLFERFLVAQIRPKSF